MSNLDKRAWAISLKFAIVLGIAATFLLLNLAADSTSDQLKSNPLFYPFEAVSAMLFEPNLHNPFIAIGVLLVILVMNCIFALPIALLVVWLWRGRRVG